MAGMVNRGGGTRLEERTGREWGQGKDLVAIVGLRFIQELGNIRDGVPARWQIPEVEGTGSAWVCSRLRQLPCSALEHRNGEMGSSDGGWEMS